jgi:hypothetical protein
MIKKLVGLAAIAAGIAGCEKPNEATVMGQIDTQNQYDLSMVSADYDKDGNPDLVLAVQEGNAGRLYFLRNIGNGTFAKPVSIGEVSVLKHAADEGGSGIALAAGDYNNDGNLDFVVGAKPNNHFNNQGTCIYLFAGDGKGNFKQGIKAEQGESK